MPGRISQLIMQIVRPLIKESVILGVASNINFDEQTCDVETLAGKADFKEVKLKGVIKNDDTGFIIYPKDGSEVAVCIIEGDEANAFVCQFTEIDSILIHLKNGDNTIFKQHLMADGTLEFNGGDLGGLINVEDLVTQMNKAQNDLNNLKSAITSWVPIPNDGGAALKVALATYLGQSVQPTTRGNIEDTKITHGSN